jgi:transcriptional antiterminator NusG
MAPPVEPIVQESTIADRHEEAGTEEVKTEEVKAEEAAPEEASPPTAEEEKPPEEPPPPPSKKRWYVVKVQSGREDSIKESIERRVKIEGLEEFFGQIIIPVEVVTEMVRGKRVKKEHKLYPGYLMVEVEYNDRILYLFRETSGVGDFVGHTIVGGQTRPPVPMSDREVERMLGRTKAGAHEAAAAAAPPPIRAKFDRGDRLRVIEGTFAGMEGEVMEIHHEKGQVKLQLTIFGRPVDVELEFWQVEKI